MVAMSAADGSPARDGSGREGAGGDGAALARIPWTTASSRPVYANPWIRVREDVAVLPDGRSTIYGVVECAGAVGILPFIDRDTVLLVGQYRYVAGDFYWEMPTGAAHAGEALETTAQRELAEEAGYEAERLVSLGSFHTSKSILDEVATSSSRRACGRRRGLPIPRSSSSGEASPSARRSPWWSAARSRTR